jgi:2-keto-4-pentenoate hydratase/2-oxohepta-3-ene-1,7-dioic acid hydratase in catechol pathway
VKLVTFAVDGSPRLGILRGDGAIDLEDASRGRLPSDMLTFLQRGKPAMELAQTVARDAEVSLALSDVTLLPPTPSPSKVIAVGRNYLSHVQEGDHELNLEPVIFAKFPSSIVGPGDAIRWDPALTGQVDYEAELAVVIGRGARCVPAAEALGYVAGYTASNDVSARDLQSRDGQWVRAKSLDTFCPLGPWLVTSDEIPDPQELAIRCVVNGEVRQDSTTAHMMFGVAELIEFISRALSLVPGDVILTGTPSGVGLFRTPQVFLKDGDTVTIEIGGIGQLTNHCVEARGA